MDATFPDPHPPTVEKAVRDIFASHRAQVDSFKLHADGGGAVGTPPNTSYFVMITYGDASPDADRLVKLLQALEAEVQEQTALDVVLYLSTPDGRTRPVSN